MNNNKIQKNFPLYNSSFARDSLVYYDVLS